MSNLNDALTLTKPRPSGWHYVCFATRNGEWRHLEWLTAAEASARLLALKARGYVGSTGEMFS